LLLGIAGAAGKKGGRAVNIIDRTITEDVASDPEMLVVFLQYALEDVRKLSGQSAALLERAIVMLADEIAETVPRSLS
jgi:hypothetical protein